MHYRILLLTGLFVLAFGTLGNAQKRLKKVSKKLQSSTVILEITFPETYTYEVTKGCGIIFHEQNDTLFILTAEHLFHLQDLPDIDPKYEKIEVSFFEEEGKPQRGQIIRSNPDLDWAMIMVKKPSSGFTWWNNYSNRQSLKKLFKQVEKNKSIKDKENVRLIAGEGEWLPPRSQRNGEILFREDQILRVQYDGPGSLPTYSGGPLVYKRGVAGLVIRQGGTSNIGDVLAADTIFSEIKKMYREKAILVRPKLPALFVGLNIGGIMRTNRSQNYLLEGCNRIEVEQRSSSSVMFGLQTDLFFIKGFSIGIFGNYNNVEIDNFENIPDEENTNLLYTFKNDIYSYGAALTADILGSDDTRLLYLRLSMSRNYQKPRILDVDEVFRGFNVIDVSTLQEQRHFNAYSIETGLVATTGDYDYGNIRLGLIFTFFDSPYVIVNSLISPGTRNDFSILLNMSVSLNTQKRTIKKLLLK